MLAIILAILAFRGYIPAHQSNACADTSVSPERVAMLHAVGHSANGDQWPYWKPCGAGWFLFPVIDQDFVRVEFSVIDSAGNESCPVTWLRDPLSVPPPDVAPLVYVPWDRVKAQFDVAGRRVDYMPPTPGVTWRRDSTGVRRKVVLK